MLQAFVSAQNISEPRLAHFHRSSSSKNYENGIERNSTQAETSHSYYFLLFFLKMGQSRPLFVYFCAFLITISIIPIEKSLTGVLGIRTHCCMMVDTDDTTELRRPPSTFIVSLPGIFRVAQYIIIPIQDFLRQNLEYLDFHLS